MAKATTNNTDNVSGTKGVKGGYIFVAPKGTTLPTNYTSALDAKFSVLGFLSEEGFTETIETDSEELKDMNGDLMYAPTTSRVESAQFTLAEIKVDTLKMMYGEDNVTETSGVITVKHNGNCQDVHCLVLELVLRDDRRWRKVIPLAQMSELDDLTLAVAELASRALTVKYLTDADGNTCYDYIQSTEASV